MPPLSTAMARAFPSGSSTTSHLPTPKNITIPRINPQPTAAKSASARPRRCETVPELAWLSTSVRRMLSRPQEVVNPHRSRYTVHSIFQRRMHAGGRHWRGGISRVASLRPFAGGGVGGLGARQSCHQHRHEYLPFAKASEVSSCARGRLELYRRGGAGGLRSTLRFARESRGLPQDAHSNFEGRRSRNAQRSRPRSGEKSEIFPRFHQRMLRRSGNLSPARGILGSRQSYRSARRV